MEPSATRIERCPICGPTGGEYDAETVQMGSIEEDHNLSVGQRVQAFFKRVRAVRPVSKGGAART